MHNLTEANLPWPALPYEAFAPTAYLLHMTVQVIGKLKLTAPFEPHWDHVPLWVTTNGLSSGLIPYGDGNFTIEMDLNTHELLIQTSWGQKGGLALTSRSVAEFTHLLFNTLHSLDIKITINTHPQEVPNPIPFEEDKQIRPYDASLAHTWWQILVSSQRVMECYHAGFLGRTPAIGLMWGTFDLRDVRYNGRKIPIDQKMDFITRNAMDAEMIEVGWWPGNETWPQAAYFSFTYPQPKGLEDIKIQPASASWNKELSEFILNYEAIRTAKNPEADLLAFFNSAYQAGANKGGWDPGLIGSGKPV
ncbi:MAG TPA: DUF5996 family protein [Gammaproteobacteria bacterium]|nr:DUF5996 family protein [Gammaproteobacteria bacterium]